MLQVLDTVGPDSLLLLPLSKLSLQICKLLIGRCLRCLHLVHLALHFVLAECHRLIHTLLLHMHDVLQTLHRCLCFAFLLCGTLLFSSRPTALFFGIPVTLNVEVGALFRSPELLLSLDALMMGLLFCNQSR